MDRRKFIKSSIFASAGTLFAANSLKLAARETENKINQDSMLRGISDIHVHASPDSKQRLIDELTFARDAYKAGYRSIMYKSNDFSCHDRAYIIRKELPDFECFGSICMNKVHGDKVNVFAAEKAIKTTGNYCRCIWMPTQDASYQYSREKKAEKGIPVLDNSGKVLPEVVRVMEICAEADIMFASGHSSPDECIAMAKKARDAGVKKFVVTHANSGIWKMTHDQIKKCIDLGAFIEYSYITNLCGPGTGLPSMERMSNKEFTDFAKINPERSFITTDLGQVGMPHPINGMRICVEELMKAGLTQKNIDLLVRVNPAELVGLKA